MGRGALESRGQFSPKLDFKEICCRNPNWRFCAPAGICRTRSGPNFTFWGQFWGRADSDPGGVRPEAGGDKCPDYVWSSCSSPPPPFSGVSFGQNVAYITDIHRCTEHVVCRPQKFIGVQSDRIHWRTLALLSPPSSRTRPRASAVPGCAGPPGMGPPGMPGIPPGMDPYQARPRARACAASCREWSREQVGLGGVRQELDVLASTGESWPGVCQIWGEVAGIRPDVRQMLRP